MQFKWKRQRGRRYNLRHRREALAAVQVIQKNGHKLTPKTKKQCDNYAEDVLGSKVFAPWLYVYSLVRGEFREGWIPDNYFGRIVVPKVNGHLKNLANLKSFSNVVLRTDALPDIGYFIDGILYDSQYSVVSIDRFRASVNNSWNAIYLKGDGGERGKNISKCHVGDLSLDLLSRFGNCVIQFPIRQHAFFNELISGPVATIRITTIRDNSGTVSVRAAYLRLGRECDSWVKSVSHIRVAIDIENLTNRGGGAGKLDKIGYNPDWSQCRSHPDSDSKFEGNVIPNFNEAVELCLGLHGRVPHITVIGWDVTIDEQGNSQLLEWNTGHCDIKFSEASSGPCFSDLGWEKFRER